MAQPSSHRHLLPDGPPTPINTSIYMPPATPTTAYMTTTPAPNPDLPLRATQTSTSPPYFPVLPALNNDDLSDIINCDSFVECTHILLNEATAARYKEYILSGCYNPHHERPFYNHEVLYEGLDNEGYRAVVEARRYASASVFAPSSGSGNRTRVYERPVSLCSDPVLVPAPAPDTATAAVTEYSAPGSLSASMYGERPPLPALAQEANATADTQAQPLLSMRLSDEGFSRIMQRTTHPSPSPSHPHTYIPASIPTAANTNHLFHPGTINWESSFTLYVLDFHEHMHSIASSRGISVADVREVIEMERWLWSVESERVRGCSGDPGRERRGGVSL
ncbi:uncharacterized protein BDV17DRAFT_160794 [Aspergillus undulatus]|uniref:uncharacterized protein n=1 Tax=Aspergillus undulatus TaxID=1810928 RepID=UPI003CCD384A